MSTPALARYWVMLPLAHFGILLCKIEKADSEKTLQQPELLVCKLRQKRDLNPNIQLLGETSGRRRSKYPQHPCLKHVRAAHEIRGDCLSSVPWQA